VLDEDEGAWLGWFEFIDGWCLMKIKALMADEVWFVLVCGSRGEPSQSGANKILF
jgi:hypothetical protein